MQKPKELMYQLDRSFPYSLEADISWHLRKKAVWDYCYCYPRIGVALIPFIEPYIRADRKLHFTFRADVFF